MLKSNKGYNLAQNVKGKIQSAFVKIFTVLFIATSLATVPVALTSCGNETAIHENLPSVSVKEMNSFVQDFFKMPPVGNIANPTSIAYSVVVKDGKVYEIKIISTANDRDGKVPVYVTTLEYDNGLNAGEIEKKQSQVGFSFSNSTVKVFENGEDVELEDIYASQLGENYVVSKEYEQSKESGIEL